MSDSVVWLYAVEDQAEISTDQKIRAILRSHFPADSLPSGDTLTISRSSRGKPFLPTLPGWHISVTHSGKWFICAFSQMQIGIDLQEHSLLPGETGQQALDRYLKIARRFFHPMEADYVALAPQDNFFPVWTAKESFVKYTGQGMDADFDAFSVLPPSHVSSHIPINTPWCTAQASFCQIPLWDGYTFCICSASPCQLRWFFPNAEELW